ncbi:MAG: hypothetical protein WC512_04525 [Candidatus Omnitrophota bacterium]
MGNRYICMLAVLVMLCGCVMYCPASQGQGEEAVALDFKTLEEAQRYMTDDRSDLKEIPESIAALEGKIVNVTGYFMVSAEDYYSKEPISSFAVSKNAYGCPCCNWGPPPTIFNTVIVDMKEGDGLEPPFSPLVEVTGIFHVKREQYTDGDGHKRLDALYYIKDAQAKKKNKSLLQSIF